MVKIAAFRLDLPDLEGWVNKELDGYGDEDDLIIPEYRKVHGQVVAKSAYHGWRHVNGDPKTLEFLQEQVLGASVAQLEAMMLEASSNGSSGTFTMFFSPGLAQEILGDNARSVEAMGTRLPVATISAVLDRVRGKILDWAIEMERQGVVGQGMTFSKKEKEDAARATTNITFTGPIGTFAGNLGTGNSSGDITVNEGNFAEALQLALSIQKSSHELVQYGANDSLLDAIKDLTTELSASSPDRGKLRSLTDHVKVALAGASGNLLALGAVNAINQIGTLV